MLNEKYLKSDNDNNYNDQAQNSWFSSGQTSISKNTTGKRRHTETTDNDLNWRSVKWTWEIGGPGRDRLIEYQPVVVRAYLSNILKCSISSMDFLKTNLFTMIDENDVVNRI